MAWTYDVTKLGDATTGRYTGATVGVRYQIRLLIQDIQSGRPLLQDEEIDWLQTQEADTYMAAAAACESLVARGGSVKSKRAGDFSVDYDVSFYRGLASSLRARSGHEVPYMGGASISDKQIDQGDADVVQPRAFTGEFDNPAVNQPAPNTESGVTSPLTLTP